MFQHLEGYLDLESIPPWAVMASSDDSFKSEQIRTKRSVPSITKTKRIFSAALLHVFLPDEMIGNWLSLVKRFYAPPPMEIPFRSFIPWIPTYSWIKRGVAFKRLRRGLLDTNKATSYHSRASSVSESELGERTELRNKHPGPHLLFQHMSLLRHAGHQNHRNRLAQQPKPWTETQE